MEKLGLFSAFPPSKQASHPYSISTLVRCWITISRPDFAIAISVIVVGIVGTLAWRANGVSAQFVGAVAVGLTVWWSAHFIGSGVNSLTDYETDALDKTGKARLSDAIDSVGSAPLWRIIFAEAVFATVFIAVASNLLEKPILVILWGIGFPLGVLYSAEPVRFKRRGLLNTVSVAITVFALPMAFMSQLFFDTFSDTILTIIVCYSIQTMAFSLGDQLPDIEFDRRTGTRTPGVVLGRMKATWLAAFIFSVSGASLLIALYSRWAVTDGAWLVALCFSIGLYGVIGWNFLTLLRLGRRLERTSSDHQFNPLFHEYQKAVRTPFWLALSGLCIIIALSGITRI